MEKHERVLVTTLTKRMAEDLTEYLNSMGVAARYLHSDIDTMERMAIIKALRAGEFDVLVGINLLREGLDIPEVSLVTILDADKEGFLRSTGSLIQTFRSRAARNAGGKVLLYADTVTASMRAANGRNGPSARRSSRTGTKRTALRRRPSVSRLPLLLTPCTPPQAKERESGGGGNWPNNLRKPLHPWTSRPRTWPGI